MMRNEMHSYIIDNNENKENIENYEENEYIVETVDEESINDINESDSQDEDWEYKYSEWIREDNEHENQLVLYNHKDSELTCMVKEDESEGDFVNEDHLDLSIIKHNMEQIKYHLWLLDSGASSHMTHDPKGFLSMENIKSNVRFANKEVKGVTVKGRWRGTYYSMTEEGNKIPEFDLILEDTILVPTLGVSEDRHSILLAPVLIG